MAASQMSPPSVLGSGAIEGRYAALPKYPKLPWYYDNSKLMYAALLAIGLIVAIGAVFN